MFVVRVGIGVVKLADGCVGKYPNSREKISDPKLINFHRLMDHVTRHRSLLKLESKSEKNSSTAGEIATIFTASVGVGTLMATFLTLVLAKFSMP